MNSGERHNGMFGNPVEGQRDATPSRVREGLVMRTIKRVIAPVATLAVLAGTPGCTRADLNDAKTQIADTNNTEDRLPENPIATCDPFRGCMVMEKDPETNQFFVTFSLKEGDSKNITFRLLDRNHMELASTSVLVNKGGLVDKSGIKLFNERVATFSEHNEADVTSVGVTSEGQAEETIFNVVPPTTVAGVDPE
jgi:hypothetical protein